MTVLTSSCRTLGAMLEIIGPTITLTAILAYKMFNVRQHPRSRGDEGGLNQQLQTSQRSLSAHRRSRSRCFSISHPLARGYYLASVMPLAVGPIRGTTELPHPHSKPTIL
jgi:hypothetical protein